MKQINTYTPHGIPANARIAVDNLTSSRSGEAVRNQFAIRVWGTIRFQSYKTTCLIWDYQQTVLTVFPAAFNYSRTTSKYAKRFLIEECGFTPEEVKEIRKIEKTADYSEDCPLFIKW